MCARVVVSKRVQLNEETSTSQRAQGRVSYRPFFILELRRWNGLEIRTAVTELKLWPFYKF